MRLVKRKLMQSKEVLENVPHNFKYHAEIKYETENGFGYTNAMGNSINELMEGISERLEYYKNREPYLQEVLYDPNGEKADVTYKIRNLLEGIKDVI